MSGNAHGPRQGKRTGASNHSSMGAGCGFESVWRELRPRTIGLLVRRGASQELAEDVAQETAIRLLRNWHLLDEDRPAWPLARRIALNCLIDHHRREQPDILAAIPDQVAPFDVEEQSLARFRLGEVWRAMAGLTQREKAVLLAELGVAGHHGNTSAIKMARLRAREKLSAAVGRSGALSAVPLQWRRFTGWLHLHGSTPYVEAGAAAGLLVIVSAAAITWGQPGHAAPKQGPSNLPSIQLSERQVTEPGARTQSDIAARRRVAPAGARQPQAARPTPTPSPTPTGATAGPARAETGKKGGATYVKICAGEDTQTPHDDVGVTVVVYDGSQEPGDEPAECKYGNDEEEEEEQP